MQNWGDGVMVRMAGKQGLAGSGSIPDAPTRTLKYPAGVGDVPERQSY